MAKTGKDKTRIQKIVVVALILIVVELVFLFVNQEEAPPTVREAINDVVTQQKNLDARGKAQMRLSLAVHDYMGANQGKPPVTLGELIPTYFDTVPVDPTTGQEFSYKIVKGRPLFGDMLEQSGKSGKPTSTKKPRDKGAPSKTDDIPATEQEALIATLDKDAQVEQVLYDPTDKRDPFLPFDFSPEIDDDPNKTELERYTIGQLKLTAVLDDANDPKALVENSAGKGYTVKKGTKIGPNKGVVVEIRKDKIMILETVVDFTGEKSDKTVEMKLRTKDQNNPS